MNPEITQAADLMDKGQIDEAQAVLQTFFATHPASLDACNLLQQIYWRKQEMPAYYEATLSLCALYIKERQPDLAMQHYDEFLNAGGTVVPAATWLDLARAMENAQAHETCLTGIRESGEDMARGKAIGAGFNRSGQTFSKARPAARCAEILRISFSLQRAAPRLGTDH